MAKLSSVPRSARVACTVNGCAIDFAYRKDMLRHRKLKHHVARMYCCPVSTCRNYRTSHKHNFKRHIEVHMKRDPSQNLLPISNWAVELGGEGNGAPANPGGGAGAQLPLAMLPSAPLAPAAHSSPYHQGYVARNALQDRASLLQTGYGPHLGGISPALAVAQPAEFPNYAQPPVNIAHHVPFAAGSSGPLPSLANPLPGPSYTNPVPSYGGSTYTHPVMPPPVSLPVVDTLQNLNAQGGVPGMPGLMPVLSPRQPQELSPDPYADMDGPSRAWYENFCQGIRDGLQAMGVPDPTVNNTGGVSALTLVAETHAG